MNELGGLIPSSDWPSGFFVTETDDIDELFTSKETWGYLPPYIICRVADC